MNNKRVLKRYPTAIAVEYRTQFDVGFRPKGVKFFVIQKSKYSKYALGFGLTEKDAWSMATIWLKVDTSRLKGYRGYPVSDARLEME
jgi:hypothetical protein